MLDVQYDTVVCKIPLQICIRPAPPRSTLFNRLAVAIYHDQLPVPSLHQQSPHLCPCPLAAHRQSHGVPSAPVCAHILQSLYVLLHLSPQVVLNLHFR